jgi:hypothetical protein
VRTMKPFASLIALWRDRPGVLLSAAVALEMLIFVYSRTLGAHASVVGVIWSGSTRNTGFLLAVCAVEAFLAWRIWRNDSWAWYFLLYLVGISAGKTFVAVVTSFSLYSLGLQALLLAQVAILVSPAVRGRRSRAMAVSPR